MKAKKFTAIILSLAMCISMMCVFASADWHGNTGTITDEESAITSEQSRNELQNERIEYLNENVFTSGSFGSAESTGNIGAVYVTNGNNIGEDVWDADSIKPGDYNGQPMFIDEAVSDNITWTLKNGILTLSGTGATAKNAGHISPFDDNPYIKTVVIEEGITKIDGDYFDNIPNLTTAIFMSNQTKANAVVPGTRESAVNLVIVGANLENGSVTNNVGTIRKPNGTGKNIVFGSSTYGAEGWSDDIVDPSSGWPTKKAYTKTELITKAKAALEANNVPAEVLNKLPSEFGGNGNNGGNTDPNPDHGNDNNHGHKGDRTVSSWAQADVTRATELGIVPADLSPDFTKGISRAEFCHIAAALYETVTGEEITGRMSFSDTNDVAVQKMASLGVINGVGDNKFAPNNTLTRAQAATIICRLGNAMGKSFIVADVPFSDTTGTWAAGSIAQVYGAGIMNGNSATTFNPNGTYTTQQSIVTMLRLYNVVA